jgi:hypothetical protein
VFIGKYDVQSGMQKEVDGAGGWNLPSRQTNEEMAAQVDGSYRAAKRMKIKGRKRKFVRIDGAPQKEDRARKRCNQARNVRCLVY